MNLIKSAALTLSIAALASSVAYGATIDWKNLTAAKFGAIKIETADDGFTKYITLDFEGPGLRPLMTLLPIVRDGENDDKIMPGERMLEISDRGVKGVNLEHKTSIMIDCNTFTTKYPKCSLMLVNGVLPD